MEKKQKKDKKPYSPKPINIFENLLKDDQLEKLKQLATKLKPQVKENA